ncbi:MAG: IMPACT family protein [Bacteroidia bacterium]
MKTCLLLPFRQPIMFSDSYYTIQHKSEGTFKDRGSRFIAYALPVENEAAVKTILLNIRKEHPGANHVCYAWQLGVNKEACRSSDDGEPSNTAGKPILAQIQSKDLTNVLVAVVRYFGGTLLGTGGLIHAYRSAAAEAIKNSAVIEKHIHLQFGIDFKFEQMNDVMRILKTFECSISEQASSETCFIRFSVRRSASQQCETRLRSVQNLSLTYL